MKQSMRFDVRELPAIVLVALAIAVALALVQSARLWWIAASRAWRLRAQTARAMEGEARAERMLQAAGFAVLARQASHRWTVRVDGEEVAVDLRADYIVQIDGRRFVAEVKTGRLAPRIDSAATRRQMLEYRCAFDVDGVLLVDAESGRIHAIEFDLPHPPRGGGWLARGIAIALAIAATIAWFR